MVIPLLPFYIYLLYCLTDDILVYLILQQLDKEGVSFCTQATDDDNSITNSLDIYESSRQIYC